jgi:hypothetical protein
MSFPKEAPARQKDAKSPSACADLPPVLTQRQSVTVVGTGRLPNIVVPLPQMVRGDLVGKSIS